MDAWLAAQQFFLKTNSRWCRGGGGKLQVLCFYDKEIAKQQQQPPLACALCHAAVPHCNFSKLIDSLLEIFFTFPLYYIFVFHLIRYFLPIVIVNFVHENNAQ